MGDTSPITSDQLATELRDIEPGLMSQVPDDKAHSCLTGACHAMQEFEPVRGR